MARKTRQKNHLLGLGLDAKDGHRRITSGEGFNLVGGSQETHDKMAETVIKTTEDLERKGKSIIDADPREIIDLLRKHGEDR
ncbi:MAG: hypothetical protein FJ410_00395 [Verrucomicrobia bacterium]|nr:hypothetical protein [Verrucomicrobiota bacterium]